MATGCKHGTGHVQATRICQPAAFSAARQPCVGDASSCASCACVRCGSTRRKMLMAEAPNRGRSDCCGG